MLQFDVIRTHQNCRFIFHVTFSFSQIFFDDQKFTFVNRIITFDEKKCFIFENDKMFFVIEIYLIKYRFLFEIRNIDFNDKRQKRIKLRQYTIITHNVLDNRKDVFDRKCYKHRFIFAIFNFLNKLIK